MAEKAGADVIITKGMEGDVEENGAVLGGQVVGLIHSVKPVNELVIDFCDEWQKWLKKSYMLF